MISEPNIQVSARIAADGTCSIKVSAIRNYGERSVTTTVDVADEKLAGQFVELAKKAEKSVHEELLKRSAQDAITSSYVAGQRNEEI